MTNIARLLAVAASIGACALGSCSHAPADARDKLQAVLQKVVDDDDDVVGALMAVDAPDHGLAWSGAAGVAQVDRQTVMTTSTAFLTASVGKLFVAAAIYGLVADGVISLDAPLSTWVDLAASGANGLPIRGGDEALARLTVRQLLAHESGLPDYFSDVSADGAPRVFELIAREPERRWTRAELFAWCRDHYAPVGSPGDFHYADTNFDLLGIVLEGATGASSYVEVIRARVLEPLGLRHTWAHSEVGPDDVVVADVFVDGVNLRSTPALSADQAGGGYITTLADLTTFVRALIPAGLGGVDDVTTDAMHAGIDVAAPLWRIRPGGVFFALGGIPELVGHSGATGVWAYYAADIDAVFVGAVSTDAWQEKHIELLLSEVVPVVQATAP